MSSNCPPQLQLSIQSNTTNFKRSFEEFGFDLESPVGPGTDVGGGGGSSVNERNKRARSSSSFSEGSDLADDSHGSSMLGSGSDSSSTSNSSLSAVEEPPVIPSGVHDGSTTSTTMRASSLDSPPRLPTPMIQDIDMAEVLPETLGSELVASQPTQPRHQQVEDRYRLSLERFNAFENEISVLRRSQPSPVATRSPTPPPILPPLSIVSSSSSLSQVSDEVPSSSRLRQIPSFHQFQNRSQRDANDRIEEEIEVVNGFRERLNSALERLRSASPLVPGLGDSGEEVVGQEEESLERERIEEDGDEEPTVPTPSLPADPPTLPPIPSISVDEWANPASFLSHNRGLPSNTESTIGPPVADQTPRDLDTARDRIRRQQTYMQQRILHMRRHQQQRILEMQQSIRSSSRLHATDTTNSSDTSRNLSLNDHPLPSPILRDFRLWMDERPPTGETSMLDGISSGLSARTDPTTTASQSTDGNINQEQREQNQPSHTRPIPSHSHTTVDSGTWQFVNSLFADQSTPSTLDTELFSSSSFLSPTAAAPGSSGNNPPSSSASNSNSDMPSNSGSVSYNRNLTDEAAVRSLDHGIGAGLGFRTGVGQSGMRTTTTPRRHAPLGEQTRNPEERRERLTQGLQGSSSYASEYVHPFFEPHEDFRLWATEHDHGTFSDLDLDFYTLAGTAGSATSSPSPSLEWDYLGASISPIRSSSPGIHRLPDFMNPTMSSLDFLSPTAAATAPSNLPVNIRHLWGESPRNRQPSHRVLHGHPSSEIDESPSPPTTTALPSTTSSTSNVTANPSNPYSQMSLRREPQRRHEIRNFFRNEEQLFGRRLAENSDSSPSATDLNPSLPSRVPPGPTNLLNRSNTMERNGSPPNSFQRPRLRSFHLQTRPGSSTSLVGENAAEVRRREDYAEITRARLRALLDNPGTQQTVDSARPIPQDGTAARLRSDDSHQVSRRQPTRPSEEPTAFEGANTGTAGGMRSRPTFDTIVQNAWQSIHGLDLPMDDESSTFGGSAINRLFGTRETASTTGNSSFPYMDTTDATRNNTNNEDVDMLAVNEDQSDEEPSWQTLDSDGDFFSWLNLNTERPTPRPSMAAQASTHRSTEGPYTSLNSSFSSSTPRRSNHWNEVTRGSGADSVSSTANRRRRYSDIFEAEPRSGSDSARPASGTNDQSLSDFVPALPSPDLGGSFDAVRSNNLSTAPRSREPYLTFGLPIVVESTPAATSGSASSTPTQDWPSRRPSFPRFSIDGDSRSRSSLWAALDHEPTRDNMVQQSHAELRTRRQVQHEELGTRNPAHAQDDRHSVTPGLFTELRTRLQEQRGQIEELSARNPAHTQNDPHNINPSAYAPGPFRNTLQHRLNEQTLARFIQARRQRLSPSNSSNPPTIPPLSFGDDNLASLSGSIQTSPRPFEATPSSSAQTSREPPRHDRVLPRPSIHTFESGPQPRYMPRSYASARSALMHEVNRDIMEHHLRSLRPGDRPSRPSRDAPPQSNASPNRNDELNAAQRQHGLPTFPRHRPHSADARPATNPPTSQNARLPQPSVLRAGAGYGRYIALSPHLMHTHSPEDPPSTTTTGHSQTPPNRRVFPGMLVDDDTSREGYPGFMRGRRARPHPHPHEMMFSFGRFGGLRRGRVFGDFMRDEDFDESYESLLSLAQTLGDVKPKSTPAEIIEKLEKGQYKDWATAESDQRCPICLDDYEQTDTVLKLNNCSHWLHQDCLHQWLQTANTCPVCRKSVHGTNAGSRPRAQAHHHHHHRNNPFSGPSTPFRHHPHPHPHLHPHPPHPRRQGSGSNSQPNPVSTTNAHVPPPLPLPSPPPPHSPSDPDQGNGSNHNDNAPWRRGPRD